MPIFSLFPTSSRRRAHEIYARLVARARDPLLYTQCGIPDTLDGRFDAILLHLFLYEQGGGALLRQVKEAFVADMDRNLREMGVGDTGVSRRIKHMASALLGRLQAYRDAWGDAAALREALKRNVYRNTQAETTQMDALLAYLQATSNSLVADVNKATVAA